jgi:hypothetical protein
VADSIYRSVRSGQIPQLVPAIDAHCHFGKLTNSFIPENTAEAMFRSMDRLGIRNAWVSSLVALVADMAWENREVANLVRMYPGRFLGLTVVNQNFPVVSEKCVDSGQRFLASLT